MAVPHPVVSLCCGRHKWQIGRHDQGKERLNSDINIDTVLVEKMLQFKLSAAHSVSISNRRGSELYSVPSSKGVLPYSGTNKITVFNTARGRAAPVGKEEMDVKSRRVNYTNASRGRRPWSSEISSRGEVEFWVGTTRSGVVG